MLPTFLNRLRPTQYQTLLRRRRRNLLLEMFEDRTVPTVLDLFTAGASGFLNSAKFVEVVATTSAGTGVFNSFVRLQASNNDFDGNSNTEQGVNYDRAGGLVKQYDELNDPNSNRKLALSEVPVVTVDGVEYREFFLDINQLNNRPYLSLDSIRISVGNAGNLRQAVPATYDPTFAGNAKQVFDLDGNGNNTLRMLSDSLDNGSGKGDVRVLVPNSNFAGVNYATPHVYLFSKFGYTAPDNLGNYYTNDGFEEWAVKTPENVATPKITVVKYTTYNGNEVDNQSIPEGSAIGWKYIATNSGNVPLTGVTVTDDVLGVNPAYQSGDANTNNVLDVSESWVYTASGTAQSAHLGTYTNLGTANGTYQTNAVTATDPSWYNPTDVAPTMTVVKTGSATVNEGGDTATYMFTITNQSVVTDTITITSLMDDQFGSLLAEAVTANNGNAIVLASGASFAFNITRPLVLDAGETHVNVVTVTGVDDEGSSDTDFDGHTVTALNVTPVVTVVKTGSATVNEGGDTANYTFTITNESVVTDTITITSLVDDRFGSLLAEAVTANGGNAIVLVSGASFTFSIARSLMLNAGQTHVNVVRVTGVDDEGTSDTGDDDHTVTARDVAPIITVVKTGPLTANVGSTVIYTYLVTNNSPASTDSELFFVSLSDTDGMPVYSSGDTDNDGALDFGETWAYTLSATMLTGTTHTNTVTARGQDDEGTLDTDIDDHTLDLTFTLHGVKVQDHDGAGFGADDTVPNASFTINVYADNNTDGDYDVGIDTLAGSAQTLPDGSYSISGLMHSKTYLVFEGDKAGWVQTDGGDPGNNYYTHVVRNSVNLMGDNFANIRIVGSGGLSKGFWGNKNGLALISGADIAGLNALNLRNEDGSNFSMTQRVGAMTVEIDAANLYDLTPSELASAKVALNTWLARTNSSNMAYMLSAQLAATYLNATVDLKPLMAGKQLAFADTRLIYVPAITAHNSQGAALEGNLNSGPNLTLVSASHTVSIAAIIAAANAALGNDNIDGIADGKVVVGAGNPARNYYEALKNVLDALNNNDAILIA